MEASDEEIERLGTRRDEALARAEESGKKYHQTENSLAGLGASESDLDEGYEEAAAAVERLETEAAELKATETEVARRKAALEARVEALRLLTERRDGSADLLGRDDVLGRLSDLITVEHGWEAAVSAALRGLAEAIVVRGLDGASSAAGYLAEADLGRAPLLVAGAPTAQGPTVQGRPVRDLLTAPDDLAGVLDRLLSGTVAVEDAEEAARVVAAQPQVLAVTRGGDLYSAWLVEGGSAAAPSLLEVQAELAEAESGLLAAGHELDQCRFAAEGLEGAAGGGVRNEEAALAELHDSDAQLAAVAEQLNSFRQGRRRPPRRPSGSPRPWTPRAWLGTRRGTTRG